jgi:hypothetical protein
VFQEVGSREKGWLVPGWPEQKWLVLESKALTGLVCLEPDSQGKAWLVLMMGLEMELEWANTLQQGIHRVEEPQVQWIRPILRCSLRRELGMIHSR